MRLEAIATSPECRGCDTPRQRGRNATNGQPAGGSVAVWLFASRNVGYWVDRPRSGFGKEQSQSIVLQYFVNSLEAKAVAQIPPSQLQTESLLTILENYFPQAAMLRCPMGV
jgi:hypothetical protein